MADADNLIAIDCFNAAQSAGEPGHCEAAAIARIGDVCNIAASWQRIVAAVPRRAAR